MKTHISTAVSLLVLGAMSFPSIVNAQTKPATNLDQANQMIVLLQKQLLVLQQQLSEMKESSKNSSNPVYYASLSTEWDAKQAKSCYVVTVAEKDDTAAVGEELSIVVVDNKTSIASLRKGKTVKLKTDDFGKVTYCGNATKITVKKSGLLKQDKAFSTDKILNATSSVSTPTTSTVTLPLLPKAVQDAEPRLQQEWRNANEVCEASSIKLTAADRNGVRHYSCFGTW